MLENRMLAGDYYTAEEDDWPDADEMSLVLEAIGYGDWKDHYPTVDVAYQQAYELNGEEMERVFHKLRREARDAAGDLLDALEDIGTPALLRTQAWFD